MVSVYIVVAVNRSPVAATNKDDDDISVPHYSLSFPLYYYGYTIKPVLGMSRILTQKKREKEKKEKRRCEIYDCVVCALI